MQITKRRCWTSSEIEYLKDNWHKKKTEDIANKLGRTYRAVYNKARQLGLGPNKAHPNRWWTKEEEEYLAEYWGVYSVECLAKKLNRTAISIQQKARKLKLGPFIEAGDYITLNQLLFELRGGISKGKTYTKQQWIEKGLPVINKKIIDQKVKVVRIDDFWKWAEENRTLIDFSKLEENALGKEPDWVKEQRKADIEMRRFKRTDWTKAEDKRLISLLKEFRWTYREIAEKLNRTEGAIKRRMIDLGLKERPISMPKHNPWTKEEEGILIDLYEKGYQPDVMTKYINRSSQAIRGKIERMIKNGELKPRSKYRKTC